MRVPLEWLREYVSFGTDAHSLARDLTMLGTKIEAVHAPATEWSGVFIGKVLDARQHPNADRLRLCRVDVGGEELGIVCGAANVRAGLTVAVARVGARLPGDVEIRRAKIRGEASEGMICSARELGLGEESGGILELDDALVSGTPFRAGADPVLEAEITPNRPDCLGLLGVAREVAALYAEPLRLPPIWREPKGTRPPSPLHVVIESPDDCGRYFGRILRNVKVGASPAWLQARLAAMGLVSINNVVDVTNYVLFETGQPVHAFDARTLRGGRVVVRRARAGETLRTLDGVERRLDPDILVIADDTQPVALAGVMGGAATAVQDSTRDLFVEVAHFRPDLVRSSRRKLGLDTDASYRFERQIDIESVRWVADRVTHLLLEVAGGEVTETSEDVYPRQPAPRRLRLRSERVNRLIGVQLGAENVAALLRRLHLQATASGGDIEVQVPSFRRDLHAEIDLIEEVARMHGYDNIPSAMVPPAPLDPRPSPRLLLLRRLRDLMIGLGYYEIRTSAFMDRRDPDRLELPAGETRRRFVTLRNPLVAALDTMRTTLLPGMLRVLQHNLNRDASSLRLACIDRVFLDLPGGSDGLPQEPERLVALLCGASRPESWSEPTRPCDVFDLSGDAEALLEHLGVDSVWTRGYTEPFVDEAASFLISGSYGVIGGGGALRSEVLRRFEIELPVYVLELDVAALEKHLPQRRTFQGVPRFPAVKRDLSVVVPPTVSYADVRTAVALAGGAALESVQCFDVFEDVSLGEGVRSLGLRLRFRSSERTLHDDMVDPWMEAIVRDLAAKLGVQRRA